MIKNKPLFSAILVTLLIFLTGCSDQKSSGVEAASGEITKTYKWKLVTTWPANFPVFQEGVERFAEDVKTMSNGRLDIQVFAGGQLIPPLGVFDAVTQGSAEMGHGAAYYWSGKVPAAQFMTTVPFGMTATGVNAWMYGGDGLKLWDEIYAPFNLKAFPMANTSAQMGGWFNKKINSTADLKGLKMRIPGLGGKVLSKAGGNPVLMAGGEIYTALERNTIDATEWVGPHHDLRLGLQRAAKYYYFPGWHEPGPTLELLLNLDAWNSLSPDLQKIIEVSAAANNVWMHAEFDVLNQQALQELKEKHTHVEILEFPKEVIEEFRVLTNEVLEEQSANDPVFKKVYENYKTFRIQNDEWDALSDGAYRNATR
ncbi:MAG: TRAP transporter substrate-binding protein [Gammaproteobacteria bacterium]